MEIDKSKMINIFQNELDSKRYLVFPDSLVVKSKYCLIHYQSKSIVLNNIPDDNMIYGTGILLYRKIDDKIFELDGISPVPPQIKSLIE